MQGNAGGVRLERGRVRHLFLLLAGRRGADGDDGVTSEQGTKHRFWCGSTPLISGIKFYNKIRNHLQNDTNLYAKGIHIYSFSLRFFIIHGTVLVKYVYRVE